MNFIDEINLVTPLSRTVLDIIQQFTGILDLGSGGRINLEQINKITLINSTAAIAFTAGRTGHPDLAV